ncbi:MAG: cobalt-precorrin-5B (C(1))-methyltransferase CbiD [Muribaculaceae bacterium]|nr:cobalt-precorrin-5B (C(1))-methyltransferase CbiD [Muribaculaceae bacterium]
MILVFGGTTEGRIAVETLDEGAGHYFYSTRGDLQKIECAHGEHIHGAMKGSDMIDFCRFNDIRLIIDAAHPFASSLHLTVGKVSSEMGIPVIRFERRYPSVDYENTVWCDSFEEAVKVMENAGAERLLALTGVQTIKNLKPYWSRHETWFRILKRDESVEIANEEGFPTDRLIYYDDSSVDSLIQAIQPDAILTKESGESGGFMEKIEAARHHGIRVFVVKRPILSADFIVVDGRHGLRREIERLLPEFYPLHTGFTTGSCATAAAKAALVALLTGKKVKDIYFKIPEGETLHMPVVSVMIERDYAIASVIKDAGDDPDVTDKSLISVKVSFAEHDGIRFFGGEGIGTITLPGLGLPVGEAAINPVPRSMMSSELLALYDGGLDVTVSLEGGEELAERTFNPRVGVVGGVSIIGTSGIVRPFSHEAFLESIRREMKVALANGCEKVIVNSGGKSEKYMKALFPGLPQQAFIHYGNAIGETMKIAGECGVEHLIIGLMLGKAVKLAEGNMDTHSHKVTVNREFLMSLAEECGCTTDSKEVMANLSLARELPSLLSATDAERFFPELLRRCHMHCSEIFKGKLDAVLIADDGKILSKTWQ